MPPYGDTYSDIYEGDDVPEFVPPTYKRWNNTTAFACSECRALTTARAEHTEWHRKLWEKLNTPTNTPGTG